ncbi:response regulator [Pedobacter sp. P351]|uniref:response regulator n=1 Tax=Pedobacter superstes TaxID=3133441 RepID=UPI0030B32A95
MRKKKLILIAEDDADDRLMINEAFMENNMPAGIVFFENGAELLDYLYSFDDSFERILPDLILLDLNMPKMDGKTVLSKLKLHNAYKEIPVIILTTSRSREEEAHVLNMGASGFFTKPSSFTELVNITASIASKWISTN